MSFCIVFKTSKVACHCSHRVLKDSRLIIILFRHVYNCCTFWRKICWFQQRVVWYKFLRKFDIFQSRVRTIRNIEMAMNRVFRFWLLLSCLCASICALRLSIRPRKNRPSWGMYVCIYIYTVYIMSGNFEGNQNLLNLFAACFKQIQCNSCKQVLLFYSLASLGHAMHSNWLDGLPKSTDCE